MKLSRDRTKYNIFLSEFICYNFYFPRVYNVWLNIPPEDEDYKYLFH